MRDEKELPRYLCHKKVWALKIECIELHAGGAATIHTSDKGYAPVEVDASWLARFRPEGSDAGYYVVYEDGYASWSPSKAFEEGYTRL